MSGPDAIDALQVARDIDDCAASQARLVDHLRSLAGVDPRRASALPEWTVGHVLTHIARNADSVLRMLDGLPQYWKGAESRNADIELGATRSWGELVDDVEATCHAVERRLREVTDWSGSVRAVTATRPKAMVPVLRRREVEVHRADLDLGYGFEHMPSGFVRSEARLLEMAWKARQPMGLTPLPAEVLRLSEHERLAWLFGRRAVEGVDPAGVY